MFKKMLKQVVMGMGLVGALLASTGCDEETAKTVAEVNMRTVSDGATLLDGGEENPFVVALHIPFYLR